MGRDEVGDRVAPELLLRGAGELERDARLSNDGESLDADFPVNTPKKDLTFSNPCLP